MRRPPDVGRVTGRTPTLFHIWEQHLIIDLCSVLGVTGHHVNEP